MYVNRLPEGKHLKYVLLDFINMIIASIYIETPQTD